MNPKVPYNKMSKRARAAADRSHRVVNGFNTGTVDVDHDVYRNLKANERAEGALREYADCEAEQEERK